MIIQILPIEAANNEEENLCAWFWTIRFVFRRIRSLFLTARETPTIIFTDNETDEKIKLLKDEGVEVVRIAEGGRNLFGVLQELGRRDLQSVLVEGGAEIAGAFCDAKLIDKVSFFIAPIVIGGRDAPTAIGGQGAQVLTSAMRLTDLEITKHGEDFEFTGYPKRN